VAIRLIIERKDKPGSEARVFENDAVLVGREVVARGAEDAWALAFPDVSRTQCRFSRMDGTLYVEGLSERNGTFVNGRRIEGTTVLRAGDQVRFGMCVIRVPADPSEGTGVRSGELGGASERSAGAGVGGGRSVAPGTPELGRVMPGVGRVIVPGGGGREAPREARGDEAENGRGPAAASLVAAPRGEHVGVSEDMSPVLARARRWDELGRPASHLLRDAEGLRRSQAWLRGGAGLGGEGALVRTFVQASEQARTSRRRRLAAVGLWTLCMASAGAGVAKVLASGLDMDVGTGVEGVGQRVCSDEDTRRIEAKAATDLLAAVKLADDEGCLAATRAEEMLRRELAGQSGRVLRGEEHEGGVVAVAARADGMRVVSIGADGSLRAWDRGGDGSSYDLARGVKASAARWSGTWLVAGGEKGEVIFFDSKDVWPPTEHPRKEEHRGRVVAIASDVGETVSASGDDGGAVAIWSLKHGSVLGRVQLGDKVEFLAFNGRGDRLVALAAGKVEEITWEGGGVRRETIFDVQAQAIALSRDGELLIGGRDGRLLLMSKKARGSWAATTLTEVFKTPVVAVAFVPHLKAALAATSGGEVVLVELEHAQRKGSDFQAYRLTTAKVRRLEVAGDRAVLVREDGVPDVWALDEDGRKQEALFRLDAAGEGAVVDVSSEHRLAFSSDPSGGLRVWHLDGRGGGGAWVLDGHHGEKIVKVALSDDEQRLASASAGGVNVYQVDRGQPGEMSMLPSSAGLAIKSLAFSPDGQMLAAAVEGEVLVWKWSDLKAEPLRGSHDGASHVVWRGASGNTKLISAGRSSLVVWDTGAEQLRAGAEQKLGGAITHLAANGARAAVATWEDEQSKIYRFDDGGDAKEMEVDGAAGEVSALALWGDEVAVGYGDGTVRWSASSGALEPVRGGDRVETLHFTPQGELVIGDKAGKVEIRRGEEKWTDAVSGLGGRVPVAALGVGVEAVVWARGPVVKLWRRDPGGGVSKDKRVIDLIGHRALISHVVTAPPGNIAVSAGEDGTVRVWPLSADRLLDLAGKGAG